MKDIERRFIMNIISVIFVLLVAVLITGTIILIKKHGFAKVGSVVFTALGAILVFVGVYLNNNQRALLDAWRMHPNRLPGTGYIVVGMMLFVAGIACVIVISLKAKSKNEKNNAYPYYHR